MLAEHHSSNVNIKNKNVDSKSIVKKEQIIKTSEINKKEELINIVYSNKGFAFIYDEDSDKFSKTKLDSESIDILSPYLPNGTS